MIYLQGERLNRFDFVADGSPSADKAAQIMRQYTQILCGALSAGGKKKAVFKVTDPLDPDRIDVRGTDDGIVFAGGKRGVLYGVYDFWEKYAGARFFAPDCHTFPEGDVNIGCVEIYETTPIKFREILGNSAGVGENKQEDWVRFRLNSNAWSRRLTDEYGGGISFAGVPAHTLSGEYLLKAYKSSHPEFFALRDGKRDTEKGQICFSAKGLASALIEEVKKLLRANPEASMVSVSQADNDFYCECEACEKKYETYSEVELFLSLVNEIADAIRGEFPHVSVHTFAYNKTCAPPKNVIPRENVVIQYCIGSCKNHAFTDETCAYNRKAKAQFEAWVQNYKNVVIWDYPNCFKYEMFCLPEFGKLRERVAYFAAHNVRGMFFEYNHREGDGSCVFSELKTYLLSKLMWDPYMAEEEYLRHAREFCHAYYGAAGDRILQYIDLYERSLCTKNHFNYDMHALDGSGPTFDLIARKDRKKFFAEAYAIWEDALRVTEGSTHDRVARDRLQLLYLDGLVNFDDSIKSGDVNEREKALAKNKFLVDEIAKRNIKITFWGQSVEKQKEEMQQCGAVSPREWNYNW